MEGKLGRQARACCAGSSVGSACAVQPKRGERGSWGATNVEFDGTLYAAGASRRLPETDDGRRRR